MTSSPAFLLLPLAAYVLVAFLFVRRASIEELLNALAKSHIAVFAFIALSTEVLSAFHWVNFPHLVGIWVLLCGALIAAVWRNGRARFLTKEAFHRPSLLSILLLGIIGFILATTLVTALLYPPNNWDSMTYHMARVPHWISNQSISFYPTAIERQNFSAPLAEFAILHLQLLSGSDLFANLVQWTCFVISIALGVLISAELSLSRREQIMAAVVIATIPMAILQSTSTQNDLVVTSFLMAFALFMLRLRKNFTAANILFASLSLGLALLTKGTSYIYGAALGLTLAAPILLQARSSLRLLIARLSCLALVCLFALLLTSGHLVRTYRLYGSPLFAGEDGMSSQDLSFPALLGSIPRNLSLHFGTTSPRLNRATDRGLRQVVGGQIDNRDNAYLSTAFSINPYRRHEDFAGNPIHLWLALFALAAALLSARRQIPARTWYAVALLLGACLFCFYLKWQPWGSRLQTPLFVLSAPLIIAALTPRIRKIYNYAALIAIVLMTLYSLPFALNNKLRPLISNAWKQKPRTQLYFMYRPELYEGYQQAIDILEKTGVEDIGLYIGGDGWEYPFWALAKARRLRFRHVGFTGPSRVRPTDTSLPEYVVVTRNTDTWPERNRYEPVFTSDHVSVLRKLLQ
jgi:hypothetical protein